MKIRLALTVLPLCFYAAMFSAPVNAQGAAGAGASSGQEQTTAPSQQPSQPSQPKIMSPRAANVQPGEPYRRPTEKEKLRSYAFISFGPYPILASAVAGGVQQADNAAPEWGQGWDAYGVRVASNFGINLVTQTTRYGLAEIFHEDTLFYRCECSGFGHRLEHALLSTVTGRRGEDGHRTFSFASLVAPYAGGEVAALAWYPSRYNDKDGFRIGNYNLAVQAGLNVAMEFIYGGPHTFLAKHHVPVLSNATGSSQQ
jgi:nitrate reductase NapE component